MKGIQNQIEIVTQNSETVYKEPAKAHHPSLAFQLLTKEQVWKQGELKVFCLHLGMMTSQEITINDLKEAMLVPVQLCCLSVLEEEDYILDCSWSLCAVIIISSVS